MNTDLIVDVDDYTQRFSVLFYADPELLEKSKANEFIHPWTFAHKYPDRLHAENGMKDHNRRHKGKFVYKIMEFTVQAKSYFWQEVKNES